MALDDSNVLVLYNAASQDGYDIAHYYQSVHPGVSLFPLTGVSTSESITADEYLTTIRDQVHSALTPSTQVIVTTKGMPLRIQVTEPKPPSVWPSPPSYVDNNGQTRVISNWQPYSSLESELAAVDKISNAPDGTLKWQMLGDQSYSLGGNTHFASNPYYGSTATFDHAATGTRLTARLDGYTVPQVESAINRAQSAFIGPHNTPNGPFHFIVDADPSKSYASPMTNLVNNVLTPAGLPVSYDNTSAFLGTSTGRVIGYDSHGTNQGLTPANYITSALNVTLANGAVFNSWESFNAFSFNPGGYVGAQGQLAQWLQIGGTAAVGNVYEPTASISTVTNEDKLFQMLLDGKTFAEAAWSSERQLSWVNTVVGDPLMIWKTLMGGDSNMDGHVDIGDLAVLGAHWGQTVPAGGLGWTMGDLNGDGQVDNADLTLVGASWGQNSSWAAGPAASASPSQASLMLGPMLQFHATPEPSSAILLAGGIGMLSVCRWAAARRRRQTRKPRAER